MRMHIFGIAIKYPAALILDGLVSDLLSSFPEGEGRAIPIFCDLLRDNATAHRLPCATAAVDNLKEAYNRLMERAIVANAPSDHSPIRLLVLSRDPAIAQGGIAVFVATQLSRFSAGIDAEPLWIGRHSTESAFATAVRMLSDVRRLKHKLKDNVHDVVQINVSMIKRSLVREFFFCRKVVRSNRHRLITVFHGWDPAVARAISRSRVLRLLFKRSFASSERVLVLSSTFAQQLQELGVDRSQVYLLPQAFDDELFSSFRTMPRNKQRNILFMSRLIPEKGALELIAAFSAGANDKWPDWSLTIAGDGPDRIAVEKAISHGSCPDRIRFAGYVRGEEKRLLLEAASVFALPTRYNEGLPIAIAEAMSAGCALLCTNVAGLADILKDNVHGAVISDGWKESIMGGLTRLLGNPDFLLSAQGNCHSLAWQRLSATSVVAELECHIAEIAK